jgi:RNA polymerase sigma-70 factor, ECF subfamily
MGEAELTTRRNAVSDSPTWHDLSSEELAWQAARGCQASFSEIVRRYAPRLQAFLNRRTRDHHDAEDLVQDTFLKAYENLDRYDHSWRFSTWLFTIAARLAVSRHRRKRPEYPAMDFQARPCDETAERHEQRESLWALAAELPQGQYQALWLRYGEEMSIREIARVLGKTQVCVKVHLHRARTRLAQRMGEMDL